MNCVSYILLCVSNESVMNFRFNSFIILSLTASANVYTYLQSHMTLSNSVIISHAFMLLAGYDRAIQNRYWTAIHNSVFFCLIFSVARLVWTDGFAPVRIHFIYLLEFFFFIFSVHVFECECHGTNIFLFLNIFSTLG